MPAQKRSFPDSPHDNHRHTKHHHQEKTEKEEEETQQEEDNYESNGSGFFIFPLRSSRFFYFLLLIVSSFSLLRFSLRSVLSLRRQFRVLSLSRCLRHTHYLLLTSFYFIYFFSICYSFDPVCVVQQPRLWFQDSFDLIHNTSFACFDFRLLRACATLCFVFTVGFGIRS